MPDDQSCGRDNADTKKENEIWEKFIFHKVQKLMDGEVAFQA